MANRYWTDNSQRSVSAKGHGPAYGRDGGKVLNDTETQPKYNANIGPDGPDLNRVGFPTVKAHVKARFFIMEGGSPMKPEGGGMLGDIGKALESVGGSMNTTGNKDESRVYEPARNSGSAPVETRFSSRVQRRGE